MRAIARETLANIAKYDLVFPSETGVYQSPNNLNRRQFRKVLTAIGLSPKVYTLYALRHSSFSLLVAAGVDIKTVSERAGHADVGITLRTYIHVNRKMAEGAADALANILYT